MSQRELYNVENYPVIQKTEDELYYNINGRMFERKKDKLTEIFDIGKFNRKVEGKEIITWDWVKQGW